MIAALRTGSWLQKDRMFFYPVVMLVVMIGSTAYVLAANGGTLPNGSPFGTDFISFWVAGREALAGNSDIPYWPERFAAAQNAIFADGNYYAFFYPPHYLAYLMPFGALPYYAALAAWTGLTFLAALAVIMAIVGKRIEVVLLTLAFPAAFLTFAHGQNAFLSAALFGGALVLLPKRPVLAGVLFGLMTFKPQLGLMIPFALLAAGQWRAIASAVATTIAAVAASAMLFGVEVWARFFFQSHFAMEALRQNEIGWNKMISTYALLRLSGLEHSPVMVAQAGVALVAAGVVIWSWRRSSDMAYEQRCAILLTASLLAPPFGLNYDLFLLAPAIAFFVAHGMKRGFPPYSKTLLAFVYISPIAVLWLMADGIAIAPGILAVLFVMIAASAQGGERPAFAAPAE